MSLLQLFPVTGKSHALQGLYISLALQKQADQGDVYIYANFIASVDGRIALPSAQAHTFMVPPSIANLRDWRLYQELAAQSDVMITSARYFRQLAAGSAQDLLPVGQSEAYADLAVWRQDRGMKLQPDVMVLSASLDIPLAALSSLVDRRVMIVTGADADVFKRKELELNGFEVFVAGEHDVEGQMLKQLLITEGYRSAYMIAGPGVHSTLISAGVLDELFLTTHLSLLGGDSFYTIAGDLQGKAARLQMQSLYMDQQDAGSQLFYRFTIERLAKRNGDRGEEKQDCVGSSPYLGS
ncbi:MAG: dihydrofolate reductase family protein [Mariprofundus sp.]|nr:dihydrofolate reductase family protein [Mariprofundus sp.]